VVFPLAVIAALAVLALGVRRFGRGPLVLGLIYVGALFPALGFVNFLPQKYSFVADHFQYHASIAVFVAIAWLVSYYLKSAANYGYALLVPLVLLSLMQSQIYKNLETLWGDTVQQNPKSWMAWNNLGNARLDAGKPDAAADPTTQRRFRTSPSSPNVRAT
jgi:hypothetical protein